MADRPRGVLPIPERRHVGVTAYDAKDPNASFPPIEPLRPPAGAPNVLLILLEGNTRLTPGTHHLRMEFRYDRGGLAKGGTVTLTLDCTTVGEGRVDATAPLVFSADETTDVGKDNGSAVSDDYTPETSAFTGSIDWVRLDIGDDGQDDLISPQDRFQAAVTRQ